LPLFHFFEFATPWPIITAMAGEEISTTLHERRFNIQHCVKIFAACFAGNVFD